MRRSPLQSGTKASATGHFGKGTLRGPSRQIPASQMGRGGSNVLPMRAPCWRVHRCRCLQMRSGQRYLYRRMARSATEATQSLTSTLLLRATICMPTALPRTMLTCVATLPHCSLACRMVLLRCRPLPQRRRRRLRVRRWRPRRPLSQLCRLAPHSCLTRQRCQHRRGGRLCGRLQKSATLRPARGRLALPWEVE